jgi:hypothetical protein
VRDWRPGLDLFPGDLWFSQDLKDLEKKLLTAKDAKNCRKVRKEIQKLPVGIKGSGSVFG